MLLVLDESIPKWHRKLSKLDRIPNCAHEPRKFAPLEAIFKNVTEFKSGLIAFLELILF